MHAIGHLVPATNRSIWICGFLAVGLVSPRDGWADIISDFTLSSENWKVIDLADTYNAGPYTSILIGPYNPSWISKAGPTQGSIYHLDTPENSFYFSAPAKFLGDLTWSYNSLLTYDLRSGTDPTGNWYSEADVILTGANNVVLVAHTFPFPERTWNTSPLLMAESYWRVGNFNGPKPTITQFLEVLSSVRSLWIRGEYYNGFDSVYLDNVHLYGSTEPRRASATASVVNGVVTGLTLIEPGYGYVTTPSVRIQGDSQSPAVAVALLAGKVVSSISVTNPGTAYTGQIIVQIDPPPRPPTLSITRGPLLIGLTATIWAGLHYRIEDSEDLQSWRNVEEFTSGADSFTRTFEPLTKTRFFRVRELP